ncbi:unnamed protein product [Lampetra fluviatilis]
MSLSTPELPFLPGNSFRDPAKPRFHRLQTLDYRNGYAQPRVASAGVGTEAPQWGPTQVQPSLAELEEMATQQALLTYGPPRTPPPPPFVPAHVIWDKKVLRFDAYFKQNADEYSDEDGFIRPVIIYYYLEDDSMVVMEPPVENSGLTQGKLMKRQQMPKNNEGHTWHWKDLNVATSITMYGKTFHIINCDRFTADFLQSEGILLNEPEEMPSNPRQEMPPPAPAAPMQTALDKLGQFLTMDRKVLRFYCVWDDKESGEVRPVVLQYYLVDDTLEVREVHQPNDGRDPFPVLLRRQRIPKDRGSISPTFPSCVLELSDQEVSGWLSPKDLVLGKEVEVMGRRFLLYDADRFTKDFYQKYLKMSDVTPVEPPQQYPSYSITREIPPYNGLGSLEDSLQNCLTLVPQPPKKDVVKMLENNGKVLRYEAVLDSVREVERGRRFIISYYLSTDAVSIYEPPVRNSGIVGGKVLEKTRISKPGTSTESPEYYGPADFAIGATIHAFGHRYIITDADKYVLKFLKENAAMIPQSTLKTFQQKHDTANYEERAPLDTEASATVQEQ